VFKIVFSAETTGVREASGLRGLQPRLRPAQESAVDPKVATRSKAPLKRAQSRRFAHLEAVCEFESAPTALLLLANLTV
jgi:hypothetical protein